MSTAAHTLKVLHLASHEINVGDGALNSAIRDRLTHLWGSEIDFTLGDVAVDRPELTAAQANEYDLVIVGGGGSISNGPFAAQNGTAMPMTIEEYSRSTTPFAFVGLGHNVFEGDPYRHGKALTQLLLEAAQRRDPFSVRNDGSLARLHRDLGDVADTVVEIPDPGFFVDAPSRHPTEASARPYALIQVAGDSLARRVGLGRTQRILMKLGKKDPTRAITDGIIDFAMRLWQSHRLDIMVAPHIPQDVTMSATIVRELYRRAGKAGAHRPFRLMGTPHPLHAKSFFGAYSAAELIVGMRGHSVICGVGLRRPTIALSTHPKVIGFMEECGVGQWSATIGKTMSGELFRLADGVLSDNGAAYFAARDPAVATFSDRFDDFLRKALDRVRENQGS